MKNTSKKSESQNSIHYVELTEAELKLTEHTRENRELYHSLRDRADGDPKVYKDVILSDSIRSKLFYKYTIDERNNMIEFFLFFTHLLSNDAMIRNARLRRQRDIYHRQLRKYIIN